MRWHETIQLGDAIHVKHGFAFKSQYFSDSGEFVVQKTPGNRSNEEGGFRLRPARVIDSIRGEHSRGLRVG